MQNEYHGPERRTFKRIRQQFSTRFRLSSVDLNPDTSQWDMIVCRNLSSGGMLFSYDKPIKTGSLLEFKIQFPLLRNAIPCAGKVSRIHKTDLSWIQEVAVGFTEIDPEYARMINVFAEDFYSKKSRRHES